MVDQPVQSDSEGDEVPLNLSSLVTNIGMMQPCRREGGDDPRFGLGPRSGRAASHELGQFNALHGCETRAIASGRHVPNIARYPDV